MFSRMIDRIFRRVDQMFSRGGVHTTHFDEKVSFRGSASTDLHISRLFRGMTSPCFLLFRRYRGNRIWSIGI